MNSTLIDQPARVRWILTYVLPNHIGPNLKGYLAEVRSYFDAQEQRVQSLQTTILDLACELERDKEERK